jgi:twitching motility protein PilT
VEQFPKILQFAVRNGVSDIHLKVGKTPYFRLDGALVTQRQMHVISESDLVGWFNSIIDGSESANFESEHEVDFAISLEGAGRFRGSAYLERGRLSLALRHISNEILTTTELGLPQKVEEIALAPRGLVLVTGATGSGKSTTVASMVQTINRKRSCHILTIEDPIEHIFTDQKSVISQREIGKDTATFASALRSAVRQDPDVIFLGELRDRETAETALQAAETGHLVLSTLHTVNALETIQRILALFPPHQHRIVRNQLAAVLHGVISQRLVRAIDGGRVPACEILVQTELVRELIADPDRLYELEEVIENGKNSYGMQSFDQALLALVRSGQIRAADALNNASRRASLQLALDGIS